jgi:hypothetical protein
LLERSASQGLAPRLRGFLNQRSIHIMKKTMFALAALGALASGSAFAQNAGDWVAGAGWFHLRPRIRASRSR